MPTSGPPPAPEIRAGATTEPSAGTRADGLVLAVAYAIFVELLYKIAGGFGTYTGFLLCALMLALAGLFAGVAFTVVAFVLGRIKVPWTSRTEDAARWVAGGWFPLATWSDVSFSSLWLGVGALLTVLLTAWIVRIVVRRFEIDGTTALFGSALSGAVFYVIFSDLLLLQRLDALRGGAWFLAYLGGLGGQAAVSIAAARLSSSEPRPWRSRWAAVVILVSTLVSTLPQMIVPGQYLRVSSLLQLTALILLAATFLSFTKINRRALASIVTVTSLLGLGLGLRPDLVDIGLQSAEGRTITGRSMLRALPLLQRANAIRFAKVEEHLKRDCSQFLSGEMALDRPKTEPVESVLLITVDTLRYDSAGYAGNDRDANAPRLNDLALESVRYHRAYAQGGWTSLSLPSLIWSKQPRDIRFTALFEADMQLYFRDEIPASADFFSVFQSPVREPSLNLGEFLRTRGVSSSAVLNDGVTHYFKPRLGFARGFDAQIYPRERLGDKHGKTLQKNGQLKSGNANIAIRDEDTVKLALAELHRLEGPHLMWVHFFNPHTPYQAGGDGIEGYLNEVAVTDAAIGKLLDGLQEAGIADRVAVIVSADHGEGLERGFRGHGLNVVEPAIQIPLLVRVPHMSGADVHQEVGLVDVAPTIVRLLGHDPPEEFVGQDLFQGRRQGPVFTETWRLRGMSRQKDTHLVSAVWKKKKIVLDLKTDDISFFDLELDPAERKGEGLRSVPKHAWAACLLQAALPWRKEGLSPGALGLD